MTTDSETSPTLSNAQKKTLRSLGHHLNPVILIGREGLTQSLIASTLAALKVHELIKVKVGKNAPVERDEAAKELARLTTSTLVQQIGKVFLLYRPNPDLPTEKQIGT
ncbi:MAG: ribosome assembly RNA-binding protein YhbY [Desulfobulbus sp.]|jgi:RNA-binding protein